MQLYYHPISSNARRVLLAAEHLGIRLDLVEVNLMNEADRRRLAEVNDNNKIPVLVDDGFMLWESCAIMQYLADSQPGQTVYPTDPLARAAAVLDKHLATRRWLVWDGVTLADYAVAAPLMYLERARLPLDAYPHLLAWFERVQALPAWRNTEAVW